jgi:hypothetical protein
MIGHLWADITGDGGIHGISEHLDSPPSVVYGELGEWFQIEEDSSNGVPSAELGGPEFSATRASLSALAQLTPSSLIQYVTVHPEHPR